MSLHYNFYTYFQYFGKKLTAVLLGTKALLLLTFVFPLVVLLMIGLGALHYPGSLSVVSNVAVTICFLFCMVARHAISVICLYCWMVLIGLRYFSVHWGIGRLKHNFEFHYSFLYNFAPTAAMTLLYTTAILISLLSGAEVGGCLYLSQSLSVLTVVHLSTSMCGEVDFVHSSAVQTPSIPSNQGVLLNFLPNFQNYIFQPNTLHSGAATANISHEVVPADGGNWLTSALVGSLSGGVSSCALSLALTGAVFWPISAIALCGSGIVAGSLTYFLDMPLSGAPFCGVLVGSGCGLTSLWAAKGEQSPAAQLPSQPLRWKDWEAELHTVDVASADSISKKLPSTFFHQMTVDLSPEQELAKAAALSAAVPLAPYYFVESVSLPSLSGVPIQECGQTEYYTNHKMTLDLGYEQIFNAAWLKASRERDLVGCRSYFWQFDSSIPHNDVINRNHILGVMLPESGQVAVDFYMASFFVMAYTEALCMENNIEYYRANFNVLSDTEKIGYAKEIAVYMGDSFHPLYTPMSLDLRFKMHAMSFDMVVSSAEGFGPDWTHASDVYPWFTKMYLKQALRMSEYALEQFYALPRA